MDTALLVYSGISVKMLVDRTFGADHVTMFTVDYEIGGAAQAHDHPFEEAYVFLAGEVEAELDGEPYTLRPGDIVFAGCRVGARVLQHGHRARPLDRDPGAPAAGSPRVSLGPELGAIRAAARTGSEGTRWLIRLRSSSSAARGRSGWRSRATTRAAANRRAHRPDPANVEAAVEAVGGDDGRRDVRPLRARRPSPLRSRRRSGPTAGARRDRSRPEHRRRLRHRQGHPARDPQARRLHRGRPHAARRA